MFSIGDEIFFISNTVINNFDSLCLITLINNFDILNNSDKWFRAISSSVDFLVPFRQCKIDNKMRKSVNKMLQLNRLKN